ncbi:MAG: hypothetical protein JST05_11115 [Acidobacteria bacterium]|nr:hypothetical protein [Acidobacteriota bacterium]
MPKFRSLALALAVPALLAAQAPAPAPAPAKAPAKHHRHAKAKGYIGDSATKTFHLASCAHVADIKADAKVAFTRREEAVQAGYKPCEDCKP